MTSSQQFSASVVPNKSLVITLIRSLALIKLLYSAGFKAFIHYKKGATDSRIHPDQVYAYAIRWDHNDPFNITPTPLRRLSFLFFASAKGFLILPPTCIFILFICVRFFELNSTSIPVIGSAFGATLIYSWCGFGFRIGKMRAIHVLPFFFFIPTAYVTVMILGTLVGGATLFDWVILLGFITPFLSGILAFCLTTNFGLDYKPKPLSRSWFFIVPMSILLCCISSLLASKSDFFFMLMEQIEK